MKYTYIPNICIRVLNISSVQKMQSLNFTQLECPKNHSTLLMYYYLLCQMQNANSSFLAGNNKSIVQDCIVRMIEPDPMKRETAGELLKAFQTAEQ